MKISVVATLLISFFVSSVFAADPVILNGLNDEINYSVGHQVGRDFVRQKVEVNPEVILQGIIDATDGNKPLMSFEKMIDTLAALREKIVERAKLEKLDAHKAGKAFLEDNAKKEGVVSLDSGLQYKVLLPGSGKKPVSGDTVKVTYTGFDILGQQIDSTTREGVTVPIEFNVDKVIPGWSEALKMMPEGAEWEIYMPHYLAFKDAGPMAGRTLIYKLKLLEVKPQK